MLHALLQVVWTEVCVHNHPIMIKIHPVFFFKSTKIFTLLRSSWSLCDVTRTEAPPTIVWLTAAFPHRLHWCLTSDPVISCCRQAWLLSDWGVLLLDVMMNTAVSGWRGLRLVLKGIICALDLHKRVYVCANHSWSSFTYIRSEYKGF